jgi:hypothetical protein
MSDTNMSLVELLATADRRVHQFYVDLFNGDEAKVQAVYDEIAAARPYPASMSDDAPPELVLASQAQVLSYRTRHLYDFMAEKYGIKTKVYSGADIVKTFGYGVPPTQK